jgi:ribonuclease P protein component
MREAARLLLAETPVTGADLVLVGRDTTRSRPFTLLIEDLRRGLQKLGVMMADQP